jgi:hypothetical protein
VRVVVEAREAEKIPGAQRDEGGRRACQRAHDRAPRGWREPPGPRPQPHRARDQNEDAPQAALPAEAASPAEAVSLAKALEPAAPVMLSCRSSRPALGAA